MPTNSVTTLEYAIHMKIPEDAPNFFDILLNFTSDSVLHIQNLSYNTNYSFIIVAANCFGIESTTQLAIMLFLMSKKILLSCSAGCNVPCVPVNGAVHNSTEGGAMVQLRCPNKQWNTFSVL